MDDPTADPGIPTLTVKLEPVNAPPVLTQIIPSGAAGLPPEPVLRAALQAELEHTIQQALDQAMEQVRERLETELPAVVERVMGRLRPG